MLFGGIAHRRADHVAKQVDELGEAIEAVEDQLRETASRPERPAIPGMPLPTGYGLQVRGPDNENIILPVCLPPGSSWTRWCSAPNSCRAISRSPRRLAAAPAPCLYAPAAAAPRERLSGTLQYVFGSGDPGFSMDETFGGRSRPTLPARRASGVETHHLA